MTVALEADPFEADPDPLDVEALERRADDRRARAGLLVGAEREEHEAGLRDDIAQYHLDHPLPPEAFRRPGPTDEPKSILDRLRANVVHADQLSNLPRPEPLIADVLDAGSFASLFGPSGSGKSFVAIDWSLCIATGTWWLRRHQVRQGPVLYVVGEGAFGLDARIAAWQTHQHGQTRGDLSFLIEPVNLLNPAWSLGLLELARELHPVLIVVDTLSRSMPGGNENASEDMTRIVDAADRLRTTGACVLLVHHTGKDLSAGSRGHSSLKGALDTEIKCEGGDHTVTLRAEKQRNHPDGYVIERLQLITVGDSCALDLYRGGPTDDADLTAKDRAALDALASIEVATGITFAEWRKTAISTFGISEGSFARHRRRLLDTHQIVDIGTSQRPRYITAGQYQTSISEVS